MAVKTPEPKIKKAEPNWRNEMGVNDDPRIGSTIYIHINYFMDNPQNEKVKLNISKLLALFPAVINELNGERLAKDVGFDDDNGGNELRRIMYLGAKAPEFLTTDEKAEVDKIIKDNKWKSAEDFCEYYIGKRTVYLKKRTGISI